jgi:hypothetical protein
MRETQELFSVFQKERAIIFALDKKIEEKFCEEAKKNEKDLLAMHSQTPRAPKKPRKKGQPLVVENKKVTPKSTIEKSQNVGEVINGIDLVLEEGRQCISKGNNQGASAYFWKAYNLATKPGDVKQRLKAMDGLCCLAISELAKLLKGIELLAKDPQRKGAFQTEAIALLGQLPKLKNTHEPYFELANTNKHLLTTYRSQS